MSRETKHVRINLKTDDGARKTKTKANSEPKQLYAIYAVVMKRWREEKEQRGIGGCTVTTRRPTTHTETQTN